MSYAAHRLGIWVTKRLATLRLVRDLVAAFPELEPLRGASTPRDVGLARRSCRCAVAGRTIAAVCRVVVFVAVLASADAARPATAAERAATLSSARFELPKAPLATPITLAVSCVTTAVPGYAATAFRGGTLGYPRGPVILWHKVDAEQPRPWMGYAIDFWQQVWFKARPYEPRASTRSDSAPSAI
jgi:hypothetical protein